jgi:hypothetical protein
LDGCLLRRPSSSLSPPLKDVFHLLVRGIDNEDVFEIDLGDEENSNWMRFVRPADDATEQNLDVDQGRKKKLDTFEMNVEFGQLFVVSDLARISPNAQAAGLLPRLSFCAAYARGC